MMGKIYNILKFLFIDLSVNGILSDPQHDDAIWCAEANPDCNNEFIITHCRKYCQSTQSKRKSILKSFRLTLEGIIRRCKLLSSI